MNGLDRDQILKRLVLANSRERSEVVDAVLKSLPAAAGTLPHDKLLQAVERHVDDIFRVSDETILEGSEGVADEHLLALVEFMERNQWVKAYHFRVGRLRKEPMEQSAGRFVRELRVLFEESMRKPTAEGAGDVREPS